MKLGKDLRAAWVSVWLDQLDVPLGENRDKVTEEPLDAPIDHP